ncbi:hypothetical protein GHA01_06650 [Novacetimonas hansenii]|uniref:Uncharacterized protein n=1 Tax=Novacetimonas hansenii TaxID=436 RepID=A0ABQ0SC78_NOVHA|nr:hypothetical protein GHA01_06650 [Novacetimonas hansenii]
MLAGWWRRLDMAAWAVPVMVGAALVAVGPQLRWQARVPRRPTVWAAPGMTG